jgi:hypothetical protein
MAGPPAVAQTPLTTSFIAQSQSRDSVDAKKRALRAQTRFEMLRRFNLPVQSTEVNPVCDARIGRFCQWNEENPRPPKEPNRIRDAREILLRTLDTAAARSPADDWIAGQRIRYLLEAGRDSAAVRAADACSGTPWWCEALRGLALHEAGANAASDSAFSRALRAMPESERCRWTDVTVLLDESQRKRYGKVGCGRREALAARLWWLADPFLAVPGNDRQTEHFARHVMSRILDGTRAGYDVRWGDDLRELVVRYGWSRYWTVSPSSSIDTRQGTISGHEAAPNYRFFPVSLKIDSTTSIGDSTWSLRDQSAPERYSPRMAGIVGELTPQIAVFRRGDSVQVVAAYDVSLDTMFTGGTVHSALVLARDERDQPVISELTLPRGWHSITVDPTPRVLSVETWSPEKKRGARLRQSLWLPQRAPNAIAVSDILLFDASPDATDLASILPHTLGSLAVAADRKLGLYWEAYGLARPDSALPVSLTLTRVSGGALRRLAQAIGLGKRSSPLSIAWRETPSMGGIASRSVVLDLSLIPRGRYKLKLELTPSGSPPVTSSRMIEIK